MNKNDIIHVPEKLEDLLGFSATCACGRTHSVELAFASIREGALDDLVPFARKTVGRSKDVVIIADRVTREICGDEAKRLLESDGHSVRVVLIPDGPGRRPHADEPGLQLVESALERGDLAVSIGSGTINDLTKLASFERGIPYITVATAPSMNGYTSAIAAIMRHGVKRTVECHQPRAVVADLEILRAAPHELVAAGLGDLESKPTATADFRLGGLLRGGYYCSAPEQVVFRAEARAAESAEGLSRGDPESIAALTEALILSGISMKLAGSSGPASGGEHLISHHWDMTAEEEGRIEGWHGAQVGVATIVTAALYERLEEVSPEDIDVDRIVAARLPRDDIERGIRKRHGARADEVIAEYFSKHLGDEDFTREIQKIRDEWDYLWRNLKEILRPASRVREILTSAGAPVTVTDLGLTRDHLRQSFIAAREIRSRYTVLDLAASLNLLEEIRDDVLNTSGCLGV
ncbi:MAG: sn-glycerol-1-phosphate dehydrogenase [Deltaproteobacteria bacterium]|nr:sn-glycerol-1-phosphate dehydrogenase [Deltaproteobacteria bacterium]